MAGPLTSRTEVSRKASNGSSTAVEPAARVVSERHLRKLLLAGRPPRYLFQFAWKCIIHTHFAIMTRQMVRGESRLVNT